jgi:hypothetical protein
MNCLNNDLPQGENICCYAEHDMCSGVKNTYVIYKTAIVILNIAVLYYFSLQIINISFNAGFSFTNTILYVNDEKLKIMIIDLLKLAHMLILICVWVSFSEFITELTSCRCHQARVA